MSDSQKARQWLVPGCAASRSSWSCRSFWMHSCMALLTRGISKIFSLINSMSVPFFGATLVELISSAVWSNSTFPVLAGKNSLHPTSLQWVSPSAGTYMWSILDRHVCPPATMWWAVYRGWPGPRRVRVASCRPLSSTSFASSWAPSLSYADCASLFRSRVVSCTQLASIPMMACLVMSLVSFVKKVARLGMGLPG